MGCSNKTGGLLKTKWKYFTEKRILEKQKWNFDDY